ncbi:MAG TPA: hypothetical protein VKI44_32140 [Acetobacteraceae bacterium]|nr:hypothetical protein [Acetobacteraceae bacterium]
MSPRHLRKGEKALIAKMVHGTPSEEHVLRDISHALVEDMNDGGMGSVRFHHGQRSMRVFGRQISEATLVDKDGVAVSVTLNLDQNGDLFELDLWKLDNSRLHKYPAPERIHVLNAERIASG